MKTWCLLTVGNSFSNNALRYLDDLADASGAVRFETGRASLGGCSLERHANLADYTERHPDYRPYTLDADTPANLQEALRARPWDVVTLQQRSVESARPERFEPWLGRLIARIRSLAPRAEIRLHQTWAYRSDSPFYPEQGLTPHRMHEGIRSAYRGYAGTYGLRLLPSGEAVQRARESEDRTFVWPDPAYDYARAEAPTLPRETHSLAVGRFWAIAGTEDGRPVLRLDANHLNARGCYLAGCTWLDALANVDVRGLAWVPEGVDPDDAAFLRGVAHEAAEAERMRG